MTISAIDQLGITLRPGERMVARLMGEAQLAAGVDVLIALQQYTGRHVPFERAIFLMVVLRSGRRFRASSTGVASAAIYGGEGISINGMAASMNRSFETVRRHVNGLIKDGICHRLPTGVLVKNDMWDTPEFVLLLTRLHDRMVGLIDDLQKFGVPLPNTPSERCYDPDASIAAMIDVTLATFECMEDVYHDWLELLIGNTVALAGARSVSFEPELGRHYGDAHAALPEELREGISVAAIARTLQMNESTVRREVAALVKSGSLIRAGRGCIRASTAYLEGEAFRRGIQLMAKYGHLILQRLVPGGFDFDQPTRCYVEGRLPPLTYS